MSPDVDRGTAAVKMERRRVLKAEESRREEGLR